MQEAEQPINPGRSSWPVLEVAAAGSVAAIMVVVFWPSLVVLWDRWGSDANYSHGYYIVPIALAICWSRRDLLDPARLTPKAWMILPLIALIGLRFWLYQRNEQYLEMILIPLFVAATALAVGGWHLLQVAWPAILFLLFMFPLPPSLNNTLAAPLQSLATLGSISTLQVLGMPVLNQGNVIIVGGERLEVARACNGLSMLLSFVTLITAMVILVRRPLWERIVLLLSTVPIALVSNVLRIVATAWCYQRFGHDAGEKIAHDWAGYLMMPLALVFVMLEMKIMSWLVIEDRAEAETRPLVFRQG